jgi:hypothetical protein
MNNLPALTDFAENKDEAEIVRFLEDLCVFQYKEG